MNAMQVFGLKVPYVRYWLGLARTIIILRETEFTGFAHIYNKKNPPNLENGMGQKNSKVVKSFLFVLSAL